MARRWRTEAYNTAKGRDKEYEGLKAKGFDVGKRWTEEHWGRIYYYLQWRFPEHYPNHIEKLIDVV